MPLPKFHIGIGLEDPTDRDFILHRFPFSNSSRSFCHSSRCDEILKASTVSILRPCSSAGGRSEPIFATASKRRNSVVANDNMKLMNALAISNEKDKKQLLDNIHSCLNAMETTRRAAKHICQLHGKFSTTMMRESMNACYH